MSDYIPKHIEPHFDYTYDIFYYFRSKESISRIMQFVFDRAIADINKIKEEESGDFYPIYFTEKGNQYQIDYSYLINKIAEFISLEMKEKKVFYQIINHFGVNSKTIKSPISKKIEDYLWLCWRIILS